MDESNLSATYPTFNFLISHTKLVIKADVNVHHSPNDTRHEFKSRLKVLMAMLHLKCLNETRDFLLSAVNHLMFICLKYA